MKIAILILALAGAAQARAAAPTQSPAIPSHSCQGIEVVPEYTCINPDAGPDIRLYVTEYQDCHNGRITNITRTVAALHVLVPNRADKIHDISAEHIKINFEKQRIHFDDRADDLTFLRPTFAEVTDGQTIFKLHMSKRMAPDYQGALDYHFVGKFEKIRANGQVTKGRLMCNIIR